VNTNNWLNRNGDLANQNDSDHDWAAGNESDIEQHTGIEDLECPAQWDGSAVPNGPRLIQPTWKSKTQDEKVFLTVNGIEMRRNKGVKKK
jgi:hypothetical protein